MRRLRPALAVLLALAALISLSGLAGAQNGQRVYLPLVPNGEGSTPTNPPTATSTGTAPATGTPTQTTTATGSPTATGTSTATTTSMATSTATATASSTARATATGTATGSPTATATATGTATGTSTATATPTLDPDGPPFGSCRVYPIGIWSGYIQGDEFVYVQNTPGEPPVNWERLAEGRFAGFTARRVYLNENPGIPGGFIWLQWDPSPTGGSQAALVASLRAPGNIEQGFTEDAWPDGFPNKPAAYPEAPGELNPGDWVATNSGLSTISEVRDALEDHIVSERLLVLPIFDESTSNGMTGVVHVVRLGLFALIDYGSDNGKRYLDLVFLGDPPQGACAYPPPPAPAATATATATPSTTSTIVPAADLSGAVEFAPEYPQITEDGSGGTSCVAVTEPWKGTLLAEEFVSALGLVYPQVGNVYLRDAAHTWELQAPLFAGPDGRLGYQIFDIPQGTYELQAYLLYRHPLDPNELPRIYADLYVGGTEVSTITVQLGGGASTVDLQLKALGEACAAG